MRLAQIGVRQARSHHIDAAKIGFKSRNMAHIGVAQRSGLHLGFGQVQAVKNGAFGVKQSVDAQGKKLWFRAYRAR